jgi:hypothetical protein
MRTILIAFIAAAAALLFAPATTAVAQQADSNRSCPVDTTTDKDTGKPRKSGVGVEVCHEGNSGSVGVSVPGKEIEHFLKYPFGQSDAGVAKQIGGAVHHFFSHL